MNQIHSNQDTSVMWSLLYSLILFTASALFIYSWTSGHNWGGDFAGYIMQAVSIVNGTETTFIKNNTFTITQSSAPEGPVAYPWGFPILLAPIYWLFGFNLNGFKSIGLIFFILFLITLYLGFKKTLEPKNIAVLLAIFAYNPSLINLGDSILSDIPFLFFSCATIFLVNNFFTNGKTDPKYYQASLIGIFAAFGFLIRANGLLLFATFIIAFILYQLNPTTRKVRGAYLSMLLGILPFICITVGVNSLFPESPNTHISLLSTISLGTVANNIFYYSFLLSEFFNPISNLKWPGILIYIASIPFVYIGIKNYWGQFWPTLIYAVLTLLLYITWSSQQGIRFLMPLVPFYVYFFIIGTTKISCQNFNKVRIIVKFFPSLIVLVFIGTQLNINYNNLSNEPNNIDGPFSLESREMFDFIQTNTKSNEVIIFKKPRVLHMITNRPSLLYSRADDIKHFNILVFDKLENGNQITLDELNKLLLVHAADLVFINSRFNIYRFKH